MTRRKVNLFASGSDIRASITRAFYAVGMSVSALQRFPSDSCLLPVRPALVAVSLSCVLLSACGGGASGVLNAGPRADDPLSDPGDGVSVDGARYPFTAAVGEVWGRSVRYEKHFNVDFTLTDGHFTVTPIVVDGVDASLREPVEASSVFTAELYAANADTFPFADYIFIATPDVGASIAGRHIFINGRLGVDSDSSGEVEADEMHDVIDGAIDFEGPLPDISLNFDLVLDNGMIATGSYDGLFEFIPLN